MPIRPLQVALLLIAAAAAQTLAAQCGGYERWKTKVGTDAAAPLIDIAHPVTISIQNLIAYPRPASVPTSNDGTRLDSEKTAYTVTCRLVKFKQEGGTGDMDYHLVLTDDTLLFTDDTAGVAPGHSIVGEVPSPTCIAGSHSDGPSVSTWQTQIVNVRNQMMAKFPSIPSSSWVDAKGVQVRVTGVAFFDTAHGQTGRTSSTGATFELHPILNIEFLDGTSTGTVTATITAPSANTTINTGTSVAFAGAASDTTSGATFSYAWDFGDGASATTASASHVFTNTGTTVLSRTVTFKATDNNGILGSASRVITVNPGVAPPATTFTETEANNTLATANVVGDTITKIVGYFPTTTDNEDYFAVTLLAGHTLTVDMVGPTDAAQDYDLYLYSSAGTLLASSEAAGTVEHVSYKNTNVSAAKTIYINAARYANTSATKPYTLTLSR